MQHVGLALNLVRPWERHWSQRDWQVILRRRFMEARQSHGNASRWRTYAISRRWLCAIGIQQIMVMVLGFSAPASFQDGWDTRWVFSLLSVSCPQTLMKRHQVLFTRTPNHFGGLCKQFDARIISKARPHLSRTLAQTVLVAVICDDIFARNQEIPPAAHRRGGAPARILFRRLCVTLHRRTGADKVAVTVNIVHAPDRRPVFVAPETGRRETALFA